MAARRSAAEDPLDHRAKGGNKNFIDLCGKPMVCWVIESLLAAPAVADVVISVEDEALVDALDAFASARSTGRLRVVRSRTNIVDSLQVALAERRGDWRPVLVTSGDNPLLTPAMIEHFCQQMEVRQLQAAITMTPADLMRATYPQGQRRFYRFADGEYSNCNFYGIVAPEAMAAAEIFRGGGQFRKHAVRMIRAFGLTNVLLYRLGRLNLADFGVRLSRAFNVSLGFVSMPFAEACIDVDNERTYLIADEILQERRRPIRGRVQPVRTSPSKKEERDWRSVPV
jgi:GTP:adenosylcobinamide-phosphate guanylyltransferase